MLWDAWLEEKIPALLPSDTLLRDPVGRATALPFSPITPIFAWRKCHC